MADLHEVSFHWPSGEPTQVIVTGTFDQWSSSLHLHKSEDGAGFSGSTKIEYGSKIAFKYVVDSEWLCSSSSPTETDGEGNINNIYQAPDLPATALMPTEEANGSSLSQLASDLVDTVAARDGTSSVLGYVASGLGATMQQSIGVDPINGTKEAVESPAPKKTESEVEETPSEALIPQPSPSIAPDVPIAIVPVYAEEVKAVSNGTPLDAPDSTVTASDPVAEAETPSTHTPSIALQNTTPSAAAENPSADELVDAPKVAVSTQTPSIAPQITTPSAAAETPSADEPVVAPKVAVSTPAPVEPSVVASDTTPEKPEAAEIPASPPGSAATPSKSSQHAFPSSETPSPTGSPSKFGTASTRKNRKSIFGKIRNIFSDKEEKEKK